MKDTENKTQIFCGDCFEIMKIFLDDNSIDACVTDPPAGISFMGKDWDKDKGGRDKWIEWMTQIFREVNRVMKPGAHGFVWAIPRTSHWMATALENAGFEIRDIVVHLFGTGFPKNYNISKGIDKKFGAEREVTGIEPRLKTPRAMASEGLDKRNCNPGIKKDKPVLDLAKQWDGWGTALKPSNERWILCRKPILSEKSSEKTDMSNVQEWVKTILSIEPLWKSIWDAILQPENMSTTKTIADLIIDLRTLRLLISELIHQSTILGETNQSGGLSNVKNVVIDLKNSYQLLTDLNTIFVRNDVSSIMDISKLLTEKLQNGGVVPKLAPFAEDIILIRKPLSEDTIVDNVLKWGTGGLDIDECSIGAQNTKVKFAFNHKQNKTMGQFEKWDGSYRIEVRGRKPANLILSHNPDCELLGEKKVKGTKWGKQKNHNKGKNSMFKIGEIGNTNDFSGTETVENWRCSDGCAVKMLDARSGAEVSRFFYIAKASKRERGEGNDHPTVKSLKLMEYLIKLVTPPKGIVLDPFMGSGTTVLACKNLGFDAIGIEIEKESLDIARRRIKI